MLYVRPRSPSEIPSPGDRFIDVVLLDMNHAWPNAGHDSIVAMVSTLANDLAPRLETNALTLRVISLNVRELFILPQAPQQAALFIGTGGPGHLDPRLNCRDAVDEGEIAECADWEEPLFALFDAIDANERAMLYGLCHSFGLLCRWSGAADPVPRGPDKGGASIGITQNVLTPQALEHPWFARLARHLPNGRHFPVVDSRHYDLIPRRSSFRRDITPIAYETLGDGSPGPALTMCEFARKTNGVPRIFAANHHPEIPNASEIAALLERKLELGEVSREWFESRAELVAALTRDDHSEPARLLAAGYAFTFLVRDGIKELIEERGRGRGRTVSSAL